MTLFHRSKRFVSLLIVSLSLSAAPSSFLNANAEPYGSPNVESSLLISQGSTSCEEALWGARATLEEGRDLSVTFIWRDISNSYDDYPDGRSDGYQFIMEGDAVLDDNSK